MRGSGGGGDCGSSQCRSTTHTHTHVNGSSLEASFAYHSPGRDGGVAPLAWKMILFDRWHRPIWCLSSPPPPPPLRLRRMQITPCPSHPPAVLICVRISESADGRPPRRRRRRPQGRRERTFFFHSRPLFLLRWLRPKVRCRPTANGAEQKTAICEWARLCVCVCVFKMKRKPKSETENDVDEGQNDDMQMCPFASKGRMIFWRS